MGNWREDHVLAEVEAALDNYEDLLSAEEMRELRAGVMEAFLFHPVLSDLIQEHAPREQAKSADVPIEGRAETPSEAAARKKSAGHE